MVSGSRNAQIAVVTLHQPNIRIGLSDSSDSDSLPGGSAFSSIGGVLEQGSGNGRLLSAQLQRKLEMSLPLCCQRIWAESAANPSRSRPGGDGFESEHLRTQQSLVLAEANLVGSMKCVASEDEFVPGVGLDRELDDGDALVETDRDGVGVGKDADIDMCPVRWEEGLQRDANGVVCDVCKGEPRVVSGDPCPVVLGVAESGVDRYTPGAPCGYRSE